MTKLISIIMPVKNGEKYLKEAIDGILKQQMDVEIIVVNDGSTDNTAKIAEGKGCVVINHPSSLGAVAAKNTGLKRARGSYIMFHDGDDVMNEGALLVLYNALETDDSISAVMGRVKDFISPDCKDPESQKNIIKSGPYYGLFTGAVLMRCDIFDKIGPFDPSVHTGEIIDWKSKMDRHHLIIKKVDVVTTNRRIHDCNWGKTHRASEFRDYAAVLRQKLKSQA